MSTLSNVTVTHRTVATLIMTDPIATAENIQIRLPEDPIRYTQLNHVYMLIADKERPTRTVRGVIMLRSGTKISLYNTYAVINQEALQLPTPYNLY